MAFHELPGDRETYQGEPVADVSRELSLLVVETDEPDRLRRDARADERVRYLEPDRRNHALALTPDDPRYPDQYGPQVTETDAAWDTTLGSTAVLVGFLDTGLEAGHEDLDDDRLTRGHDYVNGDGTPEDDAACDDHGTHVVGIAAAGTDNGRGIAGISQSAVAMHKIFDDDGSGGCQSARTSEIAQALADLGEAGAHVSSNSWTTSSSSPTLNQAIDDAHAKGTVHVAAAGNDGPCTDCVDHPWRDRPDEAAIVSCADERDDFCSFSSQGPEVDVAAPGRHVLSLDGADADGYKHLSGTSMSAPHVSGAVALSVAADGDRSFATFEDALASTADDVGLAPERQGGGRLDAAAFLDLVVNDPPTASLATTCDRLNCTFDASNSSDPDGTVSSHAWAFGDGTAGEGEVVEHAYDSAGNYTVNLTVTDDDGARDHAEATVRVVARTVHVEAIDHARDGLDVLAHAWVHDDRGQPVAGATVTLETCRRVGGCRTSVATSDEAGQATLRWGQGLPGRYTTCVTEVDHPRAGYRPAEDHAADGSCASELVLV